MEINEVTKARKYKLWVSGNHSSVKDFTNQTASDITKTNKKTPFYVWIKDKNSN